MSSFVMKPESIRDIACYVHSVIESGYNLHGFEAPDELVRECPPTLTIGKVYEKLYRMNLDAVNSRYHESEDEVPDMPDGQFFVRPEIGQTDRSFFRRPVKKHYVILKKLRCYLYQCNEGNVPESSLYRGISSLVQRLAMMIATGNDDYHSADWG